MTEAIYLIGPAGKYARVAGEKVLFDSPVAGEAQQFELTKPDDKFTLRHIPTDRILNGAPQWECGTDLNRQFETRQPNHRGPHEAWTLVTLPDGKHLAYVDHGVFTSAPLCVVKVP